MRFLPLSSVLVSWLLFTGGAHAIPDQVCEGPAGLHNRHCATGSSSRSLTVAGEALGSERAVPEPGALALFALGAGVIALRQRGKR